MVDKKIIDFKKEKNIRLIKKIFGIAKYPLAAVVVIAVLFFCAKMLGNIAVSNVTDAFNSVKLAVSSGDGYPYKLENLNVRELATAEGRPLVVYKDSTLVLDSTADTMLSCQIPAADSKVVTKNGRVLVYSNSSSEYIIHSKTEKLAEGKEGGNITAAALAENGSYATSYATSDVQSVISVYNSRQKLVFRWNCSNERIADIALSDNGRRVAMIAIGTENARFYTRLIIFDINGKEPIADVRYDGTLMLRVVYSSFNRIITVGDNKTVVHNRKGEVVDELNYSEDSIRAAIKDEKGNLLVAFSEFGGAKTAIVRFSDFGRRTCEIEVNGTPARFALNGGRFAVCDDSFITVYNSKGEEKKTVEAEDTVLDIELSANRIYTLENGEVCQY